MKSIRQVVIILLLITVVYTGISIAGNDFVANNPNIDDSSKAMLITIQEKTHDEFNYSDYNIEAGGLSEIQDEDVFARQYLEAESRVTKSTGLIEKIKNIPMLLFLSTGLDYEYFSYIINTIVVLLGLIIVFVIYKALFGPGRIEE